MNSVIVILIAIVGITIIILGPHPFWTMEFLYERHWLGKTTEDFQKEYDDICWLERELKKDRMTSNQSIDKNRPSLE